jgi:predicted lipoprotein
MITPHLSKFRLIAVFCVLTIVGFLSSCKDDNQKFTPSCISEYDISPLLVNYVDEIIIPRLESFDKQYDECYQEGENFIDNPQLENLIRFRMEYIAVYKLWQTVSAFSFGPGEDVFWVSSFNNFPLNESKVLLDVQDGKMDFSSPDDYNKGLPLLDFFLYGLSDSEEGILDSFSINNAFGIYTKAVLDDMDKKLDDVIGNWQSYANEFKQKTGTTDGQSINLLVNTLNKDYEYIKRNKIGIPSGVLSLGFTNPREVESYHSGQSLELAKTAIQSSKDLFLGTKFDGTDGEGLEEILRSIGADKNGVSLADVIINQYDIALERINAIEETLQESVDNDKQNVIDAYNALSEQVIYLKSDMPSVMCIPITYVDNPSDSD